MNREDAIRFLSRHQPLPPDESWTDAVGIEYDKVRKFFIQNPDEESIPLFLNSYGEGDGRGLYVLVEDVFFKHKKDVMVPHLLQALASKHRSVRYWCAQIAADFADPELIAPLATLLEQVDDFDMRYTAITAIEQITDVRATAVLREALERETDEDIRELLEEILA